MEITEADRERILQIIAERLHYYTTLWKSTDFAALDDSNWSANREVMLRPDFELYVRLGGDLNHPLLILAREHWTF
jgi:hypothetical protein